MRFASSAALAAMLAGAALPLPAERTVTLQAASGPTLGAANIEKLAKLVRVYFADLDAEQRGKAKKDLDKLIAETAKVAKDQKLADTLLALDDWREVLRRGLTLEKPTVTVTGRADLKEVDIASPIDPRADAKELGNIYDGKLKVLASVPNDFAKVQYPVVIALHPSDPEVGMSLSKMKKGKEIVDAAKAWAAATYSKELLAKAIVLVPILDGVKRGEDGISFSRPAWDSEDGAAIAFRALNEIVLKNLNYDTRRIYVDGSGPGAAAAVNFCTLFPGLQTGAIVRGALPKDPEFDTRFDNVGGTPLLLVGAESKEFAAKHGTDGGFRVTQKDAVDDAALVAWMTDNPKLFAPKRIKIHARELKFAISHWLAVRTDDSSIEKEPIVVEAVADREKNEITVVTNKKVKSFEIFLNDEVLDLSKEVRILHRRSDDTGEPKERFKGLLKRGIEDALDASYYRPFCNTGEVYVTSRQIDLG